MQELCRDSAKYDINHDACQCLYFVTCRKSGLNTSQTQTATGFRRFSHVDVSARGIRRGIRLSVDADTL